MTSENYVAKGNQLLGLVENVEEAIKGIDTTDSADSHLFYTHIEPLVVVSKKTMDFIEKLDLPSLCNYGMEATDAVHGWCLQCEGELQRSRDGAHGWPEILNRIHRAPHDSAQNVAERFNTPIGEALVDGGAVKWEYYKATDGLNQEQNKNKKLSVGDLKKLEEDAMQRNAWRVSQNIVD